MRKVGAPKGGRVHWLLWHLPGEFKNSYLFDFDYLRHNYIFYRLNGSKLYDFFAVTRTSKHYFRCVYVRCQNQYIEYFGSSKSIKIAEKMYDLYLLDKVNYDQN